jgi:hypothetical protein
MEATQNRTKETSRDSANHCDTCGANFPNEEALQSHANMVHYGNWNTDRPRGQRPMIDKSPPAQGDDRDADEDPSESKDDDAESPPPREMPGRESGPAGKQPAEELSRRPPQADKPRSTPERSSGGPKKEGQVPYGSPPPNREKGLDEGRQTKTEESEPMGSRNREKSRTGGGRPSPGERGQDEPKGESSDGPADAGESGESPPNRRTDRRAPSREGSQA